MRNKSVIPMTQLLTSIMACTVCVARVHVGSRMLYTSRNKRSMSERDEQLARAENKSENSYVRDWNLGSSQAAVVSSLSFI
jgi:hypothetical protein